MLKLHPKSFFVGQNQIYLPYCHSTNDVAAELAKSGEFVDGSIIFTDHQTNGRGQRGTTWESESEKNLTISFLLDTSFLKIQDQFQLSMCTALAIIDAVAYFGAKEATIKWPNDIYINNQKLGGVLIENNLKESRINYSIVGIGINVSQEVFGNPQATSLLCKGIKVERVALAEKLCEFFEMHFLRIKAGGDLKINYLQNFLGLNVTREFKYKDQTFEGIIRGINQMGELLVDSNLEKKNFDIKEISFCF